MIAFRLLVFPLFAAVLAFFFKNPARDSGEKRLGLYASFVAMTASAVCVILESPTGEEGGMLTLAKLSLLPLLGLVVFVTARAGLTLSVSKRAYILPKTSPHSVWKYGAACLVSVLAILGATVAIVRILNVHIIPLDLSSLRMEAVWVSAQFAYAVGEELVYRGGLQSVLSRYLKGVPGGDHIAIICVAIAFAGQHVGSNALATMLCVFPAGLVLGYLFPKFGLIACVVVHMISSMLAGAVLPGLVMR